MDHARRNARWLAATSGATAQAFTLLTVLVARGRTTAWDRRAKQRVTTWSNGQQSAGDVAQVTSPIGTWWSQAASSLAGAGRMLLSGQRAAALAVVGASLGAAVLTPVLERAIPLRRPPREHPEHGDPSKQSYPSGHALRTSATAVTTSYVLWREGAAPWASAPLALGSLLASGGKLVLARHWTTDLIGGYLAGISWGTACASLYELARD